MLNYGLHDDRGMKAARQKIAPLLLAGGLSALGGLARGVGSLFEARNHANQMDKYNREQEAKTLAYRTREGAHKTGAYNLMQSIAKAYGVGDAVGGPEVQGSLGAVTPTPYTPGFAEHPSTTGAIFDLVGSGAQAAGQGMQDQMTYEEYQKWLDENLSKKYMAGGPGMSAAAASADPDGGR
jgi:hypothetical protein